MNITYKSSGNLELSSRGETVVIGSGLKIGNYQVPGAGEYDVKGIQCEAVHLKEGSAYFVRLEDLTIAYLSKLETSITDLDDASATHILVVDLRSDDQAETLKAVVKSVEPSYLFLIGHQATAEFVKALGLPSLNQNLTKITRAGLPEEGTTAVLPE